MGLHQQPIKGRQIPEARIDVQIISYVITTIGHRRRVERRDPDRVNAEDLSQIVQALNDPGQVADAISIAILKTA